MGLLRRRACAYCGAVFPRIVPPSQWVVDGILAIKGLRCKECGETSLYVIDWRKAAMLWPASAVMLALPVVLHSTSVLSTAHAGGKAILVAITVCCVLGALGCFEASVQLERRPSEEPPPRWYGSWMRLGVYAVFGIGFGALTGDWRNIIVGFSVAMAFWLAAAWRGRRTQ